MYVLNVVVHPNVVTTVVDRIGHITMVFAQSLFMVLVCWLIMGLDLVITRRLGKC